MHNFVLGTKNVSQNIKMRIKLLDLNFRFHKCLDRQWRLSQFYFSYSTKVCRKRKTWAGANWLDEVFWSQRKKGVVQTLIFQNEGGGIGNRILNPCLTFLWCSMFLLWLFCVINSGCINPGAPRNVYQYTEQIHSQFRIFRKSFYCISDTFCNFSNVWDGRRMAGWIAKSDESPLSWQMRSTSWYGGAFLWNILINWTWFVWKI